ncbi:MAG: TrbI/VirB10 family protein [Leptospirillum sp.]
MPDNDDVEVMGSINLPAPRKKRFSIPKWMWGALLVLVVGIGGEIVHRKSSSLPISPAGTLPTMPSLPNSKAGVSDNPEYNRKLDMKNQETAHQAEKNGGSNVPSVRGAGPTGISKEAPPGPQNPYRSNPSADADAIRQARRGETQKEIDAARANEQAVVAKEFDGILASWSSQGEHLGILTAPKSSAQTGGNPNGPPGKSPGRAGNAKGVGKGIPIIPAGKILYGRIINELNSDRPGPVLAQAVGGKFDGVKFLGSFQRAHGTLVIKFDRVIYPDGETDSIGAYAVSPGAKLRSGLETDVNNHDLYRYGSLLASAFMQGFGQAAMYSNSTSYPSAMGTPVIGFNGMTIMQQTEMGLGQAGMMLGGQAMNAFNTPPTVKVAANTPIGLMIIAETGQKMPKLSSSAGNSPAKPGLVNAPGPSMVPQPGYPQQPMMGGGYPVYGGGYGGSPYGGGMPMMPMMP